MFTKILVIDDSNFQLRMMEKYLGDHYKVFTANDGYEGILILKNMQPDLVIIDNILKNETGYDICCKIRSNLEYRHLPVIMISSLDNPADIAKGFEAGVNAYLQKGTPAAQILKIIKDFDDKGIRIRNESILIIDDSKMIRALISSALKLIGFQILETDSGEQGIQIAIDEKPAVIICDIEMPDINGFETIQKLSGYAQYSCYFNNFAR